MLSQTFELGGKRGRRRDQAAVVSSLVDWDRQTQRQDLNLMTKEAFLAVWAAQSRLDLAVEQRELFRGLLEDLQRSVSAGATSAVELNRTRAGLPRPNWCAAAGSSTWTRPADVWPPCGTAPSRTFPG